jgi:hypothetical protein
VLLARKDFNTCCHILTGRTHKNSGTKEGTIRKTKGKAVIQWGGIRGRGERQGKFIRAAASVFNGEIGIYEACQGHFVEGDGNILQGDTIPYACGGVVKVLATSNEGVSAWPAVETSQIVVAGLPKSEE